MNLLNLEDEKFKSVKIKGYDFKVRFISPRDRVAISQRRMKLQGSNPIEAMTQGDFSFFDNIATVDTCVEEYPKGFNPHESCVNWDDEEIITLVSNAINDHTNDVLSKLKKNKPLDGGEKL